MCFTFCILCLATYVDLRIQNDFEVHFFCLPIHFPYFHVHDDATSCPLCPIISIQFHPGQECEHQVFPGHHEPHIFSFEFATSKINKASSKSTFFQVKQKIAINWRLLRTPRVPPGGKLGESRSTNLKCWSHPRQTPIKKKKHHSPLSLNLNKAPYNNPIKTY